MKVLITGAGGQLGQELQRTAPANAVVTALSSADCDVGDANSVAHAVARHDPEVIINAAGYTAVDKAESEPAVADRVNALGPAHLAAVAGRARLLHVSTDFVFDGAQGRPWRTDDRTGPLSVYGRSKLAGESPVLSLGNRGVVLRTSWVYSRFGGNFVKTMLRLMSGRPEVRVVSDQVGAPTWARGLAGALWHMAGRQEVHGLHHWRDAGAASWYDFAVAIAEEAAALQLLTQPVAVLPIGTADYPTPAKRPPYSLLDCTTTWQQLGHSPPHWRAQLRSMLLELKEDHG
jgi:dTDP-4-dehydrorhamnose reductase